MAGQEIMIAPAEARDRDAVVQLWSLCGLVRHYNPPEKDFEFARGRDHSDILTLRAEGRLAGAVMVGHDGHRGWIYYLAVDPEHQHRGYGSQLVKAAEQWLLDRHVRKCQLMVRETNEGVVDFYRGLGYENSPVLVMQRWLDGTNVT